MRILIVGATPPLMQRVAQHLEAVGMVVTRVESVEDAKERLELYPLDVVVFEDMGRAASDAKYLRRVGNKAPILAVGREPALRRAAALQAGVDVYLPWPADLEELVAYVHALARRVTGQTSSDIVVGDLKISLDRPNLVWVKGQEVPLEPKQSRLLEVFMRRPGVAFSRIQLVSYIYGDEHSVSDRVIDVFVGRLRRKLKAVFDIDYFETVWGTGYLLRKPQ